MVFELKTPFKCVTLSKKSYLNSEIVDLYLSNPTKFKRLYLIWTGKVGSWMYVFVAKGGNFSGGDIFVFAHQILKLVLVIIF